MSDIDVERSITWTAPRTIDWTPYLAGAGIGILSWIVFAVVAAPIGITTAISQVAGGLAAGVVPDVVAHNAYWKIHPFRLDYGTLFLAGTFFGALASALASRSFRIETVPASWRERFGPSPALTMYGARMAGGCTSGNGISQGLQLAVVGWTFLAVMFPVGILAATLLYRPRGGLS